MRMRFEKSRPRPLLRFWGKGQGEIAYMAFGLSGLEAAIEFPSDWHEHARAWVRFGLGLFGVAFSFPWSKVVPDHYQCSGPTYGFKFHSDILWIYHGKSSGRPRDGSMTTFNMPWQFRNHQLEILSEKETHPYTYKLHSGEVQQRTATIYAERRQWTRPWLPHKLVRQSISVEFSDEVGERTGSWKGGTIGCSYEMKPGETPLQTLRRMQAERKL